MSKSKKKNKVQTPIYNISKEVDEWLEADGKKNVDYIKQCINKAFEERKGEIRTQVLGLIKIYLTPLPDNYEYNEFTREYFANGKIDTAQTLGDFFYLGQIKHCGEIVFAKEVLEEDIEEIYYPICENVIKGELKKALNVEFDEDDTSWEDVIYSYTDDHEIRYEAIKYLGIADMTLREVIGDATEEETEQDNTEDDTTINVTENDLLNGYGYVCENGYLCSNIDGYACVWYWDKGGHVRTSKRARACGIRFNLYGKSYDLPLSDKPFTGKIQRIENDLFKMYDEPKIGDYEVTVLDKHNINEDSSIIVHAKNKYDAISQAEKMGYMVCGAEQLD